MTPRRLTPTRAGHRAVVAGILGLASAPLALVVAGTAHAAPAPVTIVYGDLNGFRPPSVSIANGGTVRWTNTGGTTVTISGHSAVCKFSVTVAGFSTSDVVGPLRSGGRCDYTGVTVLATNSGTIVVARPSQPGPPQPTASHPPPPSANPTPPHGPSASPLPTTSESGGPQPTAAPSGSPLAGSTSTSTAGPKPRSSSTDPGVTPIVSPATGGGHFRTDGVYIGRSPHRAVGLLAATALTLVAGLVAGLLRVLLAEPVGRHGG